MPAKKPTGRRAKPRPLRIDAPPEDIAKALLTLPRDHEWEYEKKPKETR